MNAASPIAVSMKLHALWHDSERRSEVARLLGAMPPLFAAAVAAEIMETLRHDPQDHKACGEFRRYLTESLKVHS